MQSSWIYMANWLRGSTKRKGYEDLQGKRGMRIYKVKEYEDLQGKRGMRIYTAKGMRIYKVKGVLH